MLFVAFRMRLDELFVTLSVGFLNKIFLPQFLHRNFYTAISSRSYL